MSDQWTLGPADPILTNRDHVALAVLPTTVGIVNSNPQFSGLSHEQLAIQAARVALLIADAFNAERRVNPETTV